MDNVEEILKAVMQLPCMKWCEAQMAKEQEPAQMAEEEEKDKKSEELPQDEPKKEPSLFEEDEKKEPHPPEELPKEEIGKEKLRMAYDQTKRQYAKLENAYQNLHNKVADLERVARRSDRKAKLMQLEAEGYAFSMADELEDVVDLEPTKFSKHLANIRKNYRKAPIGVHINSALIPDEGGTMAPEPYDPMKVLKEATKKANEKYARK